MSPDPTPDHIASPVQARLDALYERYKADRSGKVATYIPELAKADPDQFGIALATLDGYVYEAGDARNLFTIQSISKPFVYGLALEDHGMPEVLRRVGVEPSGDAFNSVVFDERSNRPFNPMVNAGAIAAAALVKGPTLEARLQRILDLFGRFVGHPVEIDNDVYRSEKATGHRNRAIAYLELNAGMIEEPVEDHLDLYFRQCSILVSARDLAVMAATLANEGINPLTGQRAISQAHVQSVLSVMQSCGMYDFSGEWAFRVGLPAKSGVGGGILAALPGQVGIGTFSPPLDERGNSVRGVRACGEFSEALNLHIFGTALRLDSVVRREYTLRDVRSRRSRGAAESALLDQEGERVRVWELQGPLGMAAVERVSRAVMDAARALPGPTHVVLDGHRVTSVEPSAAAVAADLGARLSGFGCSLLLAGFPASGIALIKAIGEERARVRETIAAALEGCEEELLQGAGRDTPDAPLVPLHELELFAGFSASELELVAPHARLVEYEPGAELVRQGEASDAIFGLAKGSLSAGVPIGESGQLRKLGSMAPGVTFGELALFEAGPRSASIHADTEATCYRLDIDTLGALATEHPGVYSKLLVNVGRSLSQRLRRANEEIRSLST